MELKEFETNLLLLGFKKIRKGNYRNDVKEVLILRNCIATRKHIDHILDWTDASSYEEALELLK